MKRVFQNLPFKHDKIYIIPTGHGIAFLGGIICMVLAGATYSNNLVYMLAFFLFSMIVVCMIQTHNNLRGVQVELHSTMDNFVNEPVSLSFRFLNNSSATRYTLKMHLLDRAHKINEFADIELVKSNSETYKECSVVVDHRGVFELPQFRISTTYPLGLFKAWKRLNVQGSYFVFPHPEGNQPLPSRGMDMSEKDGDNFAIGQQGDDFKEHKLYQTGEPLSHVDWKMYARTKQMLTKTFHGQVPSAYSFKLAHIKNMDTEKALCQMSQWIKIAEKRKLPYEFQTNREVHEMNIGREHSLSCLRELAEYREAG